MALEFWELPTPVESAVGTPIAVALPNGNTLVIYSSNSSLGAHYAIYDQFGTSVGTGQINPDAVNPQFVSDIVAHADGTYSLLYLDNGDTAANLLIQHYDADFSAIGPAIEVQGDIQGGVASKMVALPQGGFAVTYTNWNGTNWYDVFVRTVSADGTVGTPRTLGSSLVGQQLHPDIATNGSTVFAVWTDQNTGQAMGQMLSLTGQKVGSPFKIESSNGGTHGRPHVEALPSGDYIVVWEANGAPGADSDGLSARARLFASNGVPKGAEFVVNESTELDQGAPNVTVLPDGSFMVAYWGSNYDGGFRWYNADGTARTATLTTNMPLGQSALVALADGRMMAFATDSSLWRAIIDGREGKYNGDAGDNVLVSRRTGPTTIHGFAGNDTFYGNGDADTLYGDAGNDVFRSGLGLDHLYGGTGNDTYYLTPFSGFGDNLTTIHENAGEGTDTVYTQGWITLPDNVEIGILYLDAGTDSALFGNAQANELVGNNYDNKLDGAGGFDIASYIAAEGAVTVSLGLVGKAQNTGASGNDTLLSIEGLHGSHFGDTLTGDDAANTLLGDDGDDKLEGRGGNDRVDGGAGFDVASYAAAGAGVTVSLLIQGAAQNTVGAGSDTLVAIEGLSGSAFGDTLIAANTGSSLAGMAGGDTLVSGAGADRVNGGGGFDTASYARASSRVSVSLLLQGAEQDTLGGGRDTLDNIEALIGSRYGDLLIGNAYDNRLTGGDGNDELRGGNGADQLVGGNGKDTLDGGLGIDTMDGGMGDDTYVLDRADDVIIELADGGRDTMRVSGFNATIVSNVEVLVIASGAYSATGDAVANTLIGSGSNNTLSGLDGNDVLQGMAGGDTLLGGAGDDVLSGGAGQDRLTGGMGADMFAFALPADSHAWQSKADLIADFHQAEGDRIDLSAIDAIAGGANDAFTFIGTAAFGNHAGELRYRFDGAGNTVVQCDVDGNGTSDMTIVLTGEVALVTGDFVL